MVIYMKNRKKLIVPIMGLLIVGSMTGYSVLASAQTEISSTSESIFYQPQAASATVKTVNGSPAVETSGGNVDYSLYEPYGLLYDQENHYYTYNGNIVRFFNDPIAGVSFTNFYSGTVDIEAERDKDNKLIGIIECSTDVYNWHTEKYENSGLASMPSSASAMEVGNGIESRFWLREYEPYGIFYNADDGQWYYNEQIIGLFIDSEKSVVHTNETGNVYLSVSRNSKHEIVEIKEISETDAQLLMQNNTPAGEDYTTQE